jgi:large subunit ribosomal protein L5
MPPRIQERYESDVRSALVNEFHYKNPLQAPRLSKIVLNIGLGEAVQNARALDAASGDLATIAGQKPVITRAKKSISNFKVRAGNPIGLMLTLRGQRMYEFFDRLVNIALPRIRDFQGAPANAFDGRGNYHLGIREQLIFPEIDYDKIDRIRGLQVSMVTTARTDEEGRRLLEMLGMPFTRRRG